MLFRVAGELANLANLRDISPAVITIFSAKGVFVTCKSSEIRCGANMREFGFEHLFLPITWPYHRALRHHTLEPARRLAESATEEELRRNVDEWRTIKCQELDFVKAAVSLVNCLMLVERED